MEQADDNADGTPEKKGGTHTIFMGYLYDEKGDEREEEKYNVMDR